MTTKKYEKNIQLKENLKEQGFPEDVSKVPEDFSCCVKTSGVWACWGKPKHNTLSNSDWICLQVGESTDIGTEMRMDRQYSMGKFYNHKGIYKNHAGHEIFDYDRPLSKRQRVWKHIGENYTGLIFVIIGLSEDQEERLQMEERYALEKEAVYWNRSPKQRRAN